MRKKLFFLIVVGLLLGFATQAQTTTTQAIKVLLSVPDKIYDGTDSIPVADVLPGITFQTVAKDSVVTPAFKIVGKAMLSDKNADPLIKRVVTVTIELTDPTEGWAFDGVAVGSYQTVATGELTIQPKPLTFSATPAAVANKTYDKTKTGTVVASGITFTGLVRPDTLYLGTDYTATAVFNDSTVAGATSATVSLTLGNTAAAKNYWFSPNPQSVIVTKTISPAPLSVASATLDGGNIKVYDGNAMTVKTATVSGLIGGDKVTYPTSIIDSSALPVNAGVWEPLTIGFQLLPNDTTRNYYLVGKTATIDRVEISPIQLTLTAIGQKADYNGTTENLFNLTDRNVAFTVTPALGSDTVKFNGALAWGATAPLKSKNVDNYTISLGTLAPTTPNYYINWVVPATAKDTIAPRAVTITANDTTIAYGASLDRAKLSATIAPALVGTDKLTGSYNIYNAAGTVLSDPLSVGTDSIGKSGSAKTGNKTIDDGNNGGNYTVTYVAGTLTVGTPAVLTITPDAGQWKTYGEVDPVITYTVTGFKGTDTKEKVITGKLTYAGAPKAGVGLYNIILDSLKLTDQYVGNYTFLLATPTVQFEIRTANIIVYPVAKGKVQGVAEPAMSYAAGYYQVSLVNDDDPAVIMASRLLKRAGVGTAAWTVNDPIGTYAYKDSTLNDPVNPNYNFILYDGSDPNRELKEFSITKAIITIVPDSLSKAYNEVDPTFTFTTIPAALQDSVNGTLQRYGVGTAAPKQDDPIGAYNYDIRGLSSNNYLIQLVNNPKKFNILKGVIEVDADSVTKVYGDADPTLTYKVLPAERASVVTGALKRVGVGTDAPKVNDPVGDYAVLQGDLKLNNDNYSLVFKPGNLRITPKELTISVRDTSKVYGDIDPDLAQLYTVSGLVAPDTKDSVFTGSIERIAGYNVNDYAYIIGNLALKSGVTNYTFNAPASGIIAGAKFTITPATLTVYPKVASKTYGTADTSASPAVFAAITDANRAAVIDSIKGWKLGAATGLNVDDDTKLKGRLARAQYGTLAGEQAGTYDYVATSLYVDSVAPTRSNYKVVIAAGAKQFTINKKSITVMVAKDTTKLYGDADPTIAYTAAPFVNATVDNVAIKDSIGNSFTGYLNRAEGENVGSYVIKIDSLKSDNYTITLAAPARYLQILPNAKINLPDPAPVYDGNPHALPADSVKGVAGTPIITYLDEYGREISAPINAGNYTIIVSVGGVKDTITSPTYTIETAKVAVTPKAGQSKEVGAADPIFAYTWKYTDPDPATHPNLVGVPFDGQLSRVEGETVGTYLFRPGTLGAGKNFTLNIDTATVVFTITAGAGPIVPDTVTVTATALSKVYGENDPELTYTAVPADVTFTGELVRANGENVGIYAIKQGTLAASGYVIKYVGADFTINKADQEITFPALSTVKSGDVPFALGASVNTGLPLTYASSTTTVATVNGAGTVTPLKAGTTTITVSQAGNNNYNPATVSRVLTVEPGTGINNIVAEGQVSIYPSVAQRNSTITLDANVNVKNAALSVYNVNGQLISVTPVVNTVTTLSAPSAAGAYIYVFKAEGVNKTMRVLVK